MKQIFLVQLLICLAFVDTVFAQRSSVTLRNEDIISQFSRGGLTAIMSPSDSFNASPLASGAGRVELRYRIGQGDWLSHNMSELSVITSDNEVKYRYYIKGMPMSLEQHYTLVEGGMDMQLVVKTEMEFPVTIGDLAVRFPWNRPGGGSPENIFEKGFTKHHYIAGDGSFIYFTRPSGKPPYLMVLASPGTPLEYFSADDNYTVYIHSALSGSRQEGNWRYPHTSIDLEASGNYGDSVSYGFMFRWADSYDEMRSILAGEGLLDIRVVPGMSVPAGMETKIAIRTQQSLNSLTAEYPSMTRIQKLGPGGRGYELYSVHFDRLGENMINIEYGDGLVNHLEFFCTEDIETLFKKRAWFIVNRQQHRVPGKWWDGLYSVYDMKNGVLRGPENTDGFDYWWGYVLACDDPALCKAPYVAAKNVYYPEKDEIESLEYYLENFVWGGLQRTDTEEPYPYGIYGTPNWMVNRDPLLRAGVKNANLDKMNVWRSYDYPHIVMLYYHMFQIASMYPDMVAYLDADSYLERAWQTARAYFIYPYEILPWYDTYKWGCYNEIVIEDLILALEEKGRFEEAEWLRGEYEKKVKYFVYDDPYPYRSEYAIDRTAFESSYAFARYGTLNKMKPDSNLWYDVKIEKWWSHPNVSTGDARKFMDQQHYAGLAVRGWLETKYFLLGSDFTTSSDRHCLSYMARMGGWSILDYGLRFAENPYDWIELGYASYLSAWSLMNTGTEESEYGFWAPGKENDGATGWAFMSAKRGNAWIRKEVDRGAWFYDGEADLGHGSAVRMASTILADDPVFGWTAFGGDLSVSGDVLGAIPGDGLRSRFWVVDDDTRLGIELERDGFTKGKAIEWNKRRKRLSLEVMPRTPGQHLTRLFISSPGEWKLLAEGKEIPPKTYGSRLSYDLELNSKAIKIEIVKIK